MSDNQNKVRKKQEQSYSEEEMNNRIAHWREVIRLDPNNADAHWELGFDLSSVNMASEAIAQLREAIRINPNHIAAHYLLGIVLEMQGQQEEAMSEFGKAVSIDHTDESARYKASAHLSLGSALSQEGKLKEAEAHLQQAVRLQPDDPSIYAGLGLTLIEDDERKHEGVQALQTAIKLHRTQGNKESADQLEQFLQNYDI